MGVLYAIAALTLSGVFWGIIALVGYLEGFWMAVGVALPFILFYKVVGRQLDREGPDNTTHDPTLNSFQQPLSSTASQRRKLPG